MNCTNCNSVELFCCGELVYFGTAPDPLESYWLTIEDITTGKLLIVPVQINAGLMLVDISEFDFATNHSYEFKLSEAMNPNTYISWEIDSVEVECLSVRFKKGIFNNEPVNIGAQTIKL